ncbi:hypothetical protein BOX15_Mlig023333g1 [Macrostomum lignano]|uniref:Uncharacterized protein n=2 Tax=Macrostomum lignano TaxID=282301 RepID=A0A267G834_9PLAT|nr:hypothetical protein BOX15_Mlig023333g1 [Macrostomum lignano]
MDPSPQADVQKLQDLVRKLEEQNDRIRSQQQQQQQQQLSPTVKFPPPPESPPHHQHRQGSPSANSQVGSHSARHRRISFSEWDLDPAAAGGDEEQWLFRSQHLSSSLAAARGGQRPLPTLDWLAGSASGADGYTTPDAGQHLRHKRGGSSLLAKLNELALIGRLAPCSPASPVAPAAATELNSPSAAGSDERQRPDGRSSLYRQLNSPAAAVSSAGGNNGYSSASGASPGFDSRTFRRPHSRGVSAGTAPVGAGGGGGGGGGYEDSADGGIGASTSSQERLHDLTDVQIVAKMQIDALRQQVSRSRSQLSIASSTGSTDDLAASQPHQQQSHQLAVGAAGPAGLHHSAPESGHQRQRRTLPARPAQQQLQHQRPSSAMGQAYRGASAASAQQQQQYHHQQQVLAQSASVTPVVAQQRSSMLPRPNQTASPVPPGGGGGVGGARRASSGQMGLPRPVQQQGGRIPSPLRGSAAGRASVDHGASLNGGFGYHGQR